jgi:hypothetical protein
MRYGPDDPIWCVTDPTRESTLGDVCFQTSLRSLERQFRGGLSIRDTPTIFTDRAEAEGEAHLRLVAMRASDAIRDAAPEEEMRNARQVALLDADGKTIFAAELG